MVNAAGHVVGVMLAFNPNTGESFMVTVNRIPSVLFLPPPAAPSDTQRVSQEQAIETAAKMLPASIVARSDIKAEVHGWYWEVTFDNINAEAEELMPFPLRSPPPGGIYQSVVITVDAETGKLRSAAASKEPKPGPYVNRERAIESAREGVLGFLMDPSWLERAMVEAYLRGDRWIVLFWEEGASIEDRSSGLSVNRFQVSVDAVTGKVVRTRRG